MDTIENHLLYFMRRGYSGAADSEDYVLHSTIAPS